MYTRLTAEVYTVRLLVRFVGQVVQWFWQFWKQIILIFLSRKLSAGKSKLGKSKAVEYHLKIYKLYNTVVIQAST